jgi:hypothetical protein
MAKAKKARELIVLASVLIAGSSLFGTASQAHSRKHSHQTHASAGHRQPHLASAHHARSSHSDSAIAEAGTGHGRPEMRRVTLVSHRHGRTFIRTVWRPRDRNWRSLADNVYSSGVYEGGWMQCVPYARRVSGIDLTGNAYTWWNEAAGRYARGHTPQAGSVLNFRNNSRMHLGHVAVVTEVVGPREVLVTQANWGGPSYSRGGISAGVSVVDVSPSNDWTAVRVALGHSEKYGSVYPTYGFIYGHPSDSTRIADAVGSAPQLLRDQAPSDLRSLRLRSLAQVRSLPQVRSLEGIPFEQSVQFASAPSFDGPAIATSAPDRSLR